MAMMLASTTVDRGDSRVTIGRGEVSTRVGKERLFGVRGSLRRSGGLGFSARR